MNEKETEHFLEALHFSQPWVLARLSRFISSFWGNGTKKRHSGSMFDWSVGVFFFLLRCMREQS